MKGPTKQAAAVLFCLIFPVLLAFPAAAANDGSYYPIRVENPDGLKLFFVRSDVRDGGLVVFGHVRRSRLPGLVASAIRVSITGLDGNLIAEKSVTCTPRALSRHQVHNDARFYARFEPAPESGAVIRVSGQK